ncbi:MAG: hypothetical protein DMD35_08080 [Gemmatimonadetes bacterium]|nr:MAG: hypothetical protein DMD35_08080 [Gemmatimonadota bacterium]
MGTIDDLNTWVWMRQRRSEFDASRRKRFVRGQKSHERNRRRFASGARREHQGTKEELAPLERDDDGPVRRA